MVAPVRVDTRDPSRAAPRSGALPNLIVIGALRCGTSALHYYLDLHPEIQMSSPKELNFFCAEPEVDGHVSISDPCELGIVHLVRRNWWRGIDWYAGHFRAEAPVRGEASPRYTMPWHPDAAERIASVVPEAKLVFMVRDPIEQLVSQYEHYRALGVEPRDPGEALATPHGPYLERARYFARLKPFLHNFDESRIRIVSQEDLLHRRRDTMRSLFAFLGVDERFWSPKMARLRHRTERKGWRHRLLWRLRELPGARLAYLLPQEAKWHIERLADAGPSRRRPRPQLDPELRGRLADELREDVTRLRELTGREFSEWSF